jgi:hypothetical protein
MLCRFSLTKPKPAARLSQPSLHGGWENSDKQAEKLGSKGKPLKIKMYARYMPSSHKPPINGTIKLCYERVYSRSDGIHLA